MNSTNLISGQLLFPDLNLKLGDRKYAESKVHMWLFLLNEGERPTKWLKQNSKGTRVNFVTINSQEEYEEGIAELRAYASEVNEYYNLDLKVE